jgi:hypothetical protein
LLFLISTNSVYSQDPDVMTAVNNPFAEAVRPVLGFESGQLLMKLINGFHETVSLTQLQLSQAGSKSINLLHGPVDILPAETKYIGLDSKMIDLSRQIRVVLQLSPRPPKQKSEFIFLFDNGTGQFLDVESEVPVKHFPG